MKHYLTSALILLLATANAFAQNNVELVPAGGNVCNPMAITLDINGNSFNPVSYQWSTGETSPVIEIVSSGTYTLTVTGYLGNSNNLTTITKSANYNVLPAPSINALTNLWVCKGDTVRLASVSGYDLITWSNGTIGENFEKRMNLITPGTPGLDTMSVSYNAIIDGVCSVTSPTVLLRSIRKPHGVGQHYQNKMNIKTTDSIPAGLVTPFLYPVTYEMNFTDINNPLLVTKYVTQPGSRKAPASILNPGSIYTVETIPIINGQKFCSGLHSTIGIMPVMMNRLPLTFTEEDGMQIFRIYDISGRKLLEKQAEQFNREWLNDLQSQMVIVHREGKTHEVIKYQIIR